MIDPATDPMIDPVIRHLDETGQPCARHVPSSETLLAWAAVGSRIAGFHHDTASKLQSLMMALDEATELLGDERPDLQRTLDTAMAALRDIHALLTENRALAKAPQRKSVSLASLLERAANRHGVKLVGDRSSAATSVAPPSIVHALGLLCDYLAGPPQGSRTVEVAVESAGDAAMISLTGAPWEQAPPTSNEAIAVAAFLLAREEGRLACSPRGFAIQLPLADATSARSPGVKP